MDRENLRIEEGGPTLQQRRRGMRLIVVAAIALIVFGFGGAVFRQYAEWLWFTHDAGQPEVFTKTIKTQVVLWLIAMVVAFLSIFLNARASLSSQTVYDSAPADENARMAANILTTVQKFARVLAIGFAIFIGYGIANSLSSSYTLLWASQNAVEFGKNDPLFGLDIGFFVFKLPWLATISKTVIAVLFATLFITAIGYIGSGALAKVARVQLAQSKVRMHLSILGGLTLIAYGAQLFLMRYFLVLQEGTQFVGPGYAQSRIVPFYAFLGVAAIALGVLTMLNAKLWKPWRAPLIGVPLLAVLGIVLLSLYPSIIQQYTVDPNSLTLEPPYATRAIQSTRYAYGLDQFDVRDFQVRSAPTVDEVARSQTTLKSMRLWDPDILRKVYEERQSLRNYYKFFDVDVDRYEYEGEQRLVMLAPRDISNMGLDPNRKNWQNLHLRYTHGFGAVVSPVNETANEGQPAYWLNNFPPGQGNIFPLEEQRIYFASYSPGTLERDSYVLLNTKLDEFDYPADPEALHKWQGKRGIPIAGGLAKLVYSSLFGEIKFYTTGDITSGTRMLYHRDITDRASKVYPFLDFDSDPYIVLVNKRIFWILDAYTTSSMLPYSEYTSGINYIRNPVKITVDAYTGDMIAYAVDEQEPVLRTWMNVFPGLVRPSSEVPDEIRAHFRYPEDMFAAQTEVMAQYHVTDAVKFLSNEDAWQVALKRADPDEKIEPYYVQMRVPGEEKDGFMLIRPFSTRTKNNMIGWMAAFCDPKDYGRVLVFRFPRDTQTQGPVQIDSKFTADPIVADINRQFNNEQSSIVPGNLLVIPIGSSLLYVKPLFLESRSRPIPELRKVVLGLQNRVVVGDTYEEALEKLFGQQPETTVAEKPTTTTKPSETPPKSGVDVAALQEIARLLDEAEAAQRAGDWSRYGELQREARQKLHDLTQ